MKEILSPKPYSLNGNNFDEEKSIYFERIPEHKSEFYYNLLDKFGYKKVVEAIVIANEKEGEVALHEEEGYKTSCFVVSKDAKLTKKSRRQIARYQSVIRKFDKYWQKKYLIESGLLTEREYTIVANYMFYANDKLSSEKYGISTTAITYNRRMAVAKLSTPARRRHYFRWINHRVIKGKQGVPINNYFKLKREYHLSLFPKSILSKKLSRISYDGHILNALKQHNIEKVSDLLQYEPDKLTGLFGVGRTGINKLVSDLREYNVYLTFCSDREGFREVCKYIWTYDTNSEKFYSPTRLR